jgi:hypothetical protein
MRGDADTTKHHRDHDHDHQQDRPLCCWADISDRGGDVHVPHIQADNLYRVRASRFCCVVLPHRSCTTGLCPNFSAVTELVVFYRDTTTLDSPVGQARPWWTRKLNSRGTPLKRQPRPLRELGDMSLMLSQKDSRWEMSLQLSVDLLSKSKHESRIHWFIGLSLGTVFPARQSRPRWRLDDAAWQ